MGFPQIVHLVFSKNCGFPQSLFPQRIMTDLPHASHFSLPTNVWPPQNGQATVNVRPHPPHTAFSRAIGLKQFGH